MFKKEYDTVFVTLSVILLVFGIFFPISFFPKVIQPLIRYSPIFSTTSGTSSLIANFTWTNFFELLITQYVWIFIITSIGVICLGAISKFSDETMSLMAPPLAFGIIGGALRLVKNGFEATEIEMDLPEKREELYHIENDLNNADKHVKKITK